MCWMCCARHEHGKSGMRRHFELSVCETFAVPLLQLGYEPEKGCCSNSQPIVVGLSGDVATNPI